MAIFGLVIQIGYMVAIAFIGYYVIKKAVKKAIIEVYEELKEKIGK